MSARLIQVIECTEARHGSGKDGTSPVRRVTQYWSTDGVLLAEVDPCAETVRIEDPRHSDRIEAARGMSGQNGCADGG